MKPGKSADEDSLSAEHLLNAPLILINRLTSLFNQMLRHAFVPSQFKRGFMIPLVKDRQGNASDTKNYRGITISPIVSKLFEHVLKGIFFEYLSTSEQQYGFKRNSSTVHALHCLKETVGHYVNSGSRVFCAFLDASKAFDRLVHSGLFLKLIEKGVPMVFLEIIMAWYDDLWCRVKWGDQLSDWFQITAGVRQGGVLSPDLYCLYADDLLTRLRKCGKGCYLINQFAAALFYADDMAILAPSVKGLLNLLRICGDYCNEFDIGLNADKSNLMYFGKKVSKSYRLELNGKVMKWEDKFKYLGVTLKGGKVFECSITETVKKIISVHQRHPSN